MEKLIRRIGLVAHDAMKKDLIEWVLWNSELLMGHKVLLYRYHRYADTGGIKRETSRCGWDFTILKSGPLAATSRWDRVLWMERSIIFSSLPTR